VHASACRLYRYARAAPPKINSAVSAILSSSELCKNNGFESGDRTGAALQELQMASLRFVFLVYRNIFSF
jgi:hypothetical protein